MQNAQSRFLFVFLDKESLSRRRLPLPLKPQLPKLVKFRPLTFNADADHQGRRMPDTDERNSEMHFTYCRRVPVNNRPATSLGSSRLPLYNWRVPLRTRLGPPALVQIRQPPPPEEIRDV
jgi:hypothetical protein